VNKDYPIDVPLVGDAKLVLQALIDEVKALLGERGRRDDSTYTAVQDEIAGVKREWLDEWTPLLTSGAAPIHPYRLIHEINQTIDPEQTIMTHDAGHPRDEMMPFYTATVPHSYVGWGKTTHLGYGLPLMIGAKLAHPERFCVNFMGDAAFGMSGLDIETAARAGVPITTIVLNNGTMGGYSRSLPVAMGTYGAANMTGDYAKVAEGLGAVGIPVGRPDEIAPALRRAQGLNAEGRCALLDVKTAENTKMSRYPLWDTGR
jgi:thiamine pyrophosphate-dependent acetolactate synthase large subunit-like protein